MNARGMSDKAVRSGSKSSAGQTEGVSGPVLVAGASGFVGRRLCPALVDAGFEVRAMTRRPREYRGVGEAVGADASDARSLRAAMQHCATAYYLVHSLARADFEAKDAAAARAFGEAAADKGVGRIIYLGGLGADKDDLSAHLRSRRQVEALLALAGVPVTTLRAGIIIGHGGISWEITRQLVEHLPAMVVPRWVWTRTQPIAVADVIRYLVGVLQAPETAGRVFDIGGPDVLAYLEMLRRVAAVEGRKTLIVPVPLLSPSLSSLWLSLVTNVDVRTGRSLVDSMTNEVVVRDDSIRRVVPFEPMGFDSAVLEALGERARAASLMSPRLVTEVPRGQSESDVAFAHRRRVVARVLVGGAAMLGLSFSTQPGSRRFYVSPWAWRARGWSAGCAPGRCTWAGFGAAGSLGSGR